MIAISEKNSAMEKALMVVSWNGRQIIKVNLKTMKTQNQKDNMNVY
jgi:hypothetical protein